MKQHNQTGGTHELTQHAAPVVRIQDVGRGSVATVNVRIALPNATTVKVRFTCPVANVDNVVGQLRQILEPAESTSPRADLTQRADSAPRGADGRPTVSRPAPFTSTPATKGARQP